MAAKRKTKRTATSKSGRKYTKHPHTGRWVEVKSYRRTKPTRHATAAEKRVHSCASTRRKKLHAKRRKSSR